jgi:hypothetical protein
MYETIFTFFQTLLEPCITWNNCYGYTDCQVSVKKCYIKLLRIRAIGVRELQPQRQYEINPTSFPVLFKIRRITSYGYCLFQLLII